MWIFMNDAMLSIVEHRDDPAKLMVRARIAGDIERAFPEAEVSETPRADYRFRATLDRREVAAALAAAAMGIDYDNFKNSVDDSGRHHAYMGVWSVMNEEQHRRIARRNGSDKGSVLHRA